MRWNSILNDRIKNGKNLVAVLGSQSQRRHILRWIRSLKKDYLFEAPCPWLVFDAIDYIRPRMFKSMNVFEYGSGGSTLFWLNCGANVVSIEHDPQWSEHMRKRLQSYKSIDYRLITPEENESENQNKDRSDPDSYGSRFNYVSQIDAFPDQYFDIVLIDGKARPSCIKHSVSKVKLGGMIILDNADRDYYLLKTEKFFEGFSKNEFFGIGPQYFGAGKTNVYTKIDHVSDFPQ